MKSTKLAGKSHPHSILNFTLEDLTREVEKMGEKRFRASQIVQCVYKELRNSFSDMISLPTTLRGKLCSNFSIEPFCEIRQIRSRDGLTFKSLLRLDDGELIETTLMRYKADGHRKPRATVCVSTQAGCAMGCTFCATGQQGFSRHLETGEIVGQVTHMERLARKEAIEEGYYQDNNRHGVTNVVFMGMGEPLHNYDNTMRAIRILNDQRGLGIAARRITVSTVGLVPQIHRLSNENLQINLAVSLHAPDDVTRSETVPVTRRWMLKDLMAACREYCARTGRRIFFEYVMLKGQNDSIAHSRHLGALLKGMLCHVNLIPVNPTKQGPYMRTNRTSIVNFQKELAKYGIASTQRMEKGIDIQAGCGQLKGQEIQKGAPDSLLHTSDQ